MPVRSRALALSLSILVGAVASALPAAPARAAAPKVTIIVGPVGSLTPTYRSMADRVATAATAAGATVVKAYSPSATWANVKAAVSGANVIVYFGHGNGYPNPYGSTELVDRTNGWGLNRTTTNGDGDSWTSTLAYCGERVLLGQLTSADDSVRQTYCGGTSNDGIAPAAGFTMVYAQAHYAPGFGERYNESDPLTTLAEAQQRVRNYSYPILRLGGSYLATAYGDADQIVTRLLTQPTSTYADIFRAGKGYSGSTLTTMSHPDVSGSQVWVQRTSISGMHFGDPDYWYAFAGDPNRTPSGTAVPRPGITRLYPGPNSTNGATNAIVTATFDRAVVGVSSSSFMLRTLSGQGVAAAVTYNAYWKRAELRTSSPMAPGTTYVATLTSAITSTDGGALPTTSWRFTTAQEPIDGMQTYSPAMRLVVRQGTHTGYRFDGAGSPTAVRTVTLAASSGASTSMSGVLPAQSGTWYYIVDGAWAGHWVRASSAVQPEATATLAASTGETYQPAARIVVRRGTHTGYRFGTNGAPLAERTVSLAWDSGADASRRSTIVNQYGDWFEIVNGAWAGYWLRASDVVFKP